MEEALEEGGQAIEVWMRTLASVFLTSKHRPVTPQNLLCQGLSGYLLVYHIFYSISSQMSWCDICFLLRRDVKTYI